MENEINHIITKGLIKSGLPEIIKKDIENMRLTSEDIKTINRDDVNHEFHCYPFGIRKRIWYVFLEIIRVINENDSI